MDIINKRRSIRKYTAQDISKDDILKMLEAGMNAPTARNRQEWRFFVVKDKEVLAKIPTALPHAQFAKDANAVMIVCADLELASHEGYGYVDCAAATQNILLQATELGIGTCWCAIAPNEDRINPIKELFNLSENILPVACIVMGYPDEEKEENHRYDEEKVTWIL